MSILSNNGKKVCVILKGGNVVTKIIKNKKAVWELENDMLLKFATEVGGDLLLKFAVAVAKGTKLVRISEVDVLANTDYAAGDYLYFPKGRFQPSRIQFAFGDTDKAYNYYSEVRFLKGLDCSNLTSLNCAFGSWGNSAYSLRLATVIDVSHLDTNKVTNMVHVFRYCIALKQLDVSDWNTSNVTTMNYMFNGCRSLTSLNVSNFDTSKVTNMGSMFSICSSLTTLNVSNFDTSKVTNMGSMFSSCSSLTNLIFGSKWGTQTSTAANALTLDLSTIATSKSYKLTDDTYNSMLTMYDRASNGLTTMTIKFSKRHNLPDGFAEKMSALGYTITLV